MEVMDTVQETAERMRLWHRGEPQPPFTLELYPTMRCNLSCSFCDTTYRKGSEEDELSKKRYLEIAREAGEMGVRRAFILGGGEPMVKLDTTLALMERLKGYGIWGMMTTNGTIFPGRAVEKVVEIGWDEIHFSIDGPNPLVNDRLRGREGVFEKNMEAIGRINEAKKASNRRLPVLVIHTVVTRMNFHLFREMVELARSLNCRRVNFDYLIAYRPEQEVLKISESEAGQVPAFAEEGMRRADSLGIETTLHQFLRKETLKRGEMKFRRRGGKDILNSTCFSPWHHLVINTEGFVSPCCVITGDVESVRERSLREVWFEGDYFRGMRERMKARDPHPLCRNCSMNIMEHNENIRGRLL